jgi:hypothetical protein
LSDIVLTLAEAKPFLKLSKSEHSDPIYFARKVETWYEIRTRAGVVVGQAPAMRIEGFDSEGRYLEAEE